MKLRPGLSWGRKECYSFISPLFRILLTGVDVLCGHWLLLEITRSLKGYPLKRCVLGLVMISLHAFLTYKTLFQSVSSKPNLIYDGKLTKLWRFLLLPTESIICCGVMFTTGETPHHQTVQTRDQEIIVVDESKLIQDGLMVLSIVQNSLESSVNFVSDSMECIKLQIILRSRIT